MKQLKPGQLCTIYGKWWNPLTKTIENRKKHVYRCKKTTIFGTCTECKKMNKNNRCLFPYDGDTCFKLFGTNYPVLVK